MTLHPTIDDPALRMDPEATTRHLVQFLQSELRREPRHRGFVVGLSGGVDSAVTAALAVRAVGPERVTNVLLPERDSQRSGVELARKIAAQLDTETVEIDLTPALEALGVYARREEIVREHFPDFESDWRYRLVLPGDLRETEAMNLYQLEVLLPNGRRRRRRPTLPQLRALQASTNVKQRMRMAALYREAESRGALVVGTTNRAELGQGFFVRYGDGGVDLEPLAHLYKTQVWALGEYLGLPREVIERPPSPDTWSAPVDDGEFYFRLPYAMVDLLLAARDRGESHERAAERLGLEPKLVQRAFDEFTRRERASVRLHELPPSPAPLAPETDA